MSSPCKADSVKSGAKNPSRGLANEDRGAGRSQDVNGAVGVSTVAEAPAASDNQAYSNNASYWANYLAAGIIIFAIIFLPYLINIGALIDERRREHRIRKIADASEGARARGDESNEVELFTGMVLGAVTAVVAIVLVTAVVRLMRQRAALDSHQGGKDVIAEFIQTLLKDRYISRLKVVFDWLSRVETTFDMRGFIEESVVQLHGSVIDLDDIEAIELFEVEGGFTGTTRLVYGVNVLMRGEQTGPEEGLARGYSFVLKIPKGLTDTLGPEVDGMQEVSENKRDHVKVVPKIGAQLAILLPNNETLSIISEEYIKGHTFEVLIAGVTDTQLKREYALKAIFTILLVYLSLRGRSPLDFNVGNLIFEESSGLFILIDDGSPHDEVVNVLELASVSLKPYILLIAEGGQTINLDMVENMMRDMPEPAEDSGQISPRVLLQEFKQAAESLLAAREARRQEQEEAERLRKEGTAPDGLEHQDNANNGTFLDTAAVVMVAVLMIMAARGLRSLRETTPARKIRENRRALT